MGLNHTSFLCVRAQAIGVRSGSRFLRVKEAIDFTNGIFLDSALFIIFIHEDGKIDIPAIWKAFVISNQILSY